MSRIVNRSIVTVSILSMLISCTPPTEAETTGSLSGTIYDSASSSPLSGAEIRTEPPTSTVITDQTGAYSIEGIEPGNYSVTASAAAYSSRSESIAVTAGKNSRADIYLSGAAPLLNVDNTYLDFDSETSALTFTVSNDNQGSVLNWTASEQTAWLDLDKTSGMVSSSPTAVTVTVDRSALDLGIYNGAITVSGDGGTVIVTVRVRVPGPELVLSANEMNFGTVEDSQTLYVENAGPGTLDYDTEWAAPWLSVDPSSGSLTTETDNLNITVDRTALAPGNYYDVVSVITDANSVSMKVMMTVASTDGPQLSAFPVGLDFGEDRKGLDLVISNTGTGLLAWNAVADKSWIVLPASDGTISDTPEILTITVDPLGLDPGEYLGTISVNSIGGNQVVSVSMTVPDQPALSLVPAFLDLGTDLNSLTFTIANAGTGTLNWSLSPSTDWITASPTEGTGYATVNVSVDRTDLPAGIFSGMITVNSSGGVSAVYVDLTVPEDLPPTAPVLSAPAAVTDRSMTLSWSRNYEDDFAAYLLYRSGSPAVNEGSTLVATLTASTSNSFTDSTLSPKTTYYYKVYTMDQAENTTGSNVVSATTAPAVKTWHVFTDLGAMSLYDISILSDDYAYAVGEGGAIFFYDGTDWTQETSPTTYDLSDLKIISETQAWARYQYGVLHYNGTSWSMITDQTFSNSLYSLDALGSDVWVGDNYSRIYHYNGSTWSSIEINVGTIMDIKAIASDDVWALGYYGELAHYDGISWSVITEGPVSTSFYARELYVVSTTDIRVFGRFSSTYVYKWNGSSWSSELTMSSSSYSNDASFGLASNDIWTALNYSTSTSSNLLFHWNGVEYISQTMPTDNAIYDIYMLNSDYGMAVGYSGTILIYY